MGQRAGKNCAIPPRLAEPELDRDRHPHLDLDGTLPRRLEPVDESSAHNRPALAQAPFRYDLNADAMATEKLAEGIRNFVADQVRLEKLISER